MRETVAILGPDPHGRLGRVRARGGGRDAGPKVVIVVGATHCGDVHLPLDADAAYAEALKYTTNVVKVYSPERDVGHGQGRRPRAQRRHLLRPRERLAQPVHLRQQVHDQGRLRPQRHVRRRRLQQQVLRRALRLTLELAPNAIVLLHHLCYASGNSEPGGAPPSVSTAKQRMDNYAPGFLERRRPRRSSPTAITDRPTTSSHLHH